MMINSKGCVIMLGVLLVAGFAIYSMGSVLWNWIV